MKEAEIKAAIIKGKYDNVIHLGQKQGLAKFTREDLIVLKELLRNEYRNTTDLALEDMTVSDHEAATLGELPKWLPLSKFSLQGIHLGDQCIEMLAKALTPSDYTASSAGSSSSSSTDVNPSTNLLEQETRQGQISGLASGLTELVVGGHEATDRCLPLLTQILLNNPSIKMCSINWAKKFTAHAAWQMVSTIAVHNISLVENDFHGFFHSYDFNNPKAIDFINSFVEMITLRNRKLAQAQQDQDKYNIYASYLQDYNKSLVLSFPNTTRLYDLKQFNARDLVCKPLSEVEFKPLLAQQKSVAIAARRNHANIVTSAVPSPGITIEPIIQRADDFMTSTASPVSRNLSVESVASLERDFAETKLEEAKSQQ